MDIASLARAIPAATAVGLAGLGYGGLLPRPAARAAVEVPWAIGLGLLGSAVMLVGLLGVLGTPSMALLVGAGLALLAAPTVRHRIASDRKPTPGTLLSLLLLLPSTVASLVPPVFFDSAVYHVTLPFIYLARGNIGVLPESNYSFYPATAEMLYTAALGLGGVAEACAPLHVLAAALAALAAASLARAVVGESAAGPAALLVLSVPSVLAQAAIPKNDLFVAAFFAAALVCLVEVMDDGGSVLLLGLALGGALATKHTAIYLVAALGTAALVRSARNAPVRRRLLAALALAALPPLPWYLRSFLASGNPVYPAMTGIFGSAPFQRAGFLMPGERRELPFSKLLALPVHLSFGWTGYGIFSNYGPALLLLIVVAVLARARVRYLGTWIACCGLAALAWWKTFNDARYLAPLLPLLAVWGAAGLVAGGGGRGAPRWLMRLMVLLLVASNLLAPARPGHSAGAMGLLGELMDPMAYVLGRESRATYLARAFPPYATVAFANRELPPGSAVLFIGETRGLYLNRPFRANTAHDRTEIVNYVATSRDLPNLLQKLHADGFTHVLVSRPELRRLQAYGPYLYFETPRQWGLYDEFMTRVTRSALYVDARHGISLHSLPSGDD